MEPATFTSLQSFMLHTKTIVYVLMGAGLVGLGCFWWFLSARDENIKKF